MITRFLLVTTVLLTGYCVVVMAIMYPWLWLVIAIGAIYLSRKQYQLSAFGTVRWASASEMKANGMLERGNGLIIGTTEYATGPLVAVKELFDRSVPSGTACEQFLRSRRKPTRKLVRLNKAVHSAIFAPVGVGKSTGVATPFLLTCEESCVVVDFKGELANITAEARRKMGHKVVICDPFKVVTQSPDTFNALQFIGDDHNALDHCRSVAAEIVIRAQEKGDGVYFLDKAEEVLSAFIALVVCYGNQKSKSLQMVCDLVSSPDNWTKSIEAMTQTDKWGGMLSRMGGGLKHLKDRELGSTLSTTIKFLRFLSTPAIAASTTASTFDPGDLLKKKMTVYLVIPPEFMRTQSALLRLWIGSMLRAVIAGGLKNDKKVHFILDEAASLGHMDSLDDAVDKYRGYGVRLQLYYQSLGQLKKCWPDGQDQTLLSNVSQVFIGVNDNETAKYVSERLGEETIIVEDTGTAEGDTNQSSPQGGHSRTSSRNRNRNFKQTAHKLLKPEQVMALDQGIALTFAPGVPPIWTNIIRYYDAAFKNRNNWAKAAIRRFITAIFMVVVIGAFAVLVSALANQKYGIIDPPATHSAVWPVK